MRDQEPNWGLAFGSGSFLIVWCVGFLSKVPFEDLIGRAVVAAMMGTLLGVMVGYTISGIKAMREDLDKKGHRVDFTVGDDDEPLPQPLTARPRAKTGALGDEGGEGVRERVVPAAEGAEGFQPLDYKAQAKQVQSMVQE